MPATFNGAIAMCSLSSSPPMKKVHEEHYLCVLTLNDKVLYQLASI